MYKIIGADGEIYGPVGADELRQWIAEGRANGQSKIQADGSAEWRALGTFPEFADALTAVAIAPPLPLSVVPIGGTKTNGLAVAGFILGLLSLPTICCCCLNLPCTTLGLIFSCVAISQINNNPMQRGKGFAIAGIILSVIGLILLVICIALGGINGALNNSSMFE
jgi:hypothetical protein